MGSFLVQIWRGSRWSTVALFYTREAAEQCFALYTKNGMQVRIA
jgi:hypothetical protein